MSVPCSVATEVGRLHESVRGHVNITVDAVDLAVIEVITRTHVEQIVMSGEHLEAFASELNKAVRKARKARLRAVSA